MKKRMMIPLSIMLIGMMALTGSVNAAPNYGRHGREMSQEQREAMRMKLKRTHVRGTVEQVTDQTAYIRTTPAEVVAVRLGPMYYWQQHDFRLVPGQRVLVAGWYDPYMNSDVVYGSRISGSGFKYTLVKQSGEPMWATNYTETRGWNPTYNVYETWYRPDYSYGTSVAVKTTPVKSEKSVTAKAKEDVKKAKYEVKKATHKSKSAKHNAKSHTARHHTSSAAARK